MDKKIHFHLNASIVKDELTGDINYVAMLDMNGSVSEVAGLLVGTCIKDEAFYKLLLNVLDIVTELKTNKN